MTRASGLSDVAARLARWFARQQRDLPWRRTRDPYAIWVSEIMLQQTRVETVIPYYEAFMARFPTVEALAAASQDEVLKRWEGLGYYARARNMHRAAHAVREAGRGMPRRRDDLLALPGIGRYTAGAVASIAYGERVAAVDGNVERVVSRLLAMETGNVWPHAEALVAAAADPSVHNQAMMELGATVCVPLSPRCDVCPVRSACAGLESGEPTRYPARSRAKVLPQRDVYAALLWRGERFFIFRRPSEGLLGGLWDLPWAEGLPRERAKTAVARAVAMWAHGGADVGDEIAQVRHVFTHFRMRLRVHACQWRDGSPDAPEEGRWITPSQRGGLAFPKATLRVFDAVFAASSPT